MKKTTNNTTELVFILDRSGSMSGLEDDTIGGFNSILEKQRKQAGSAYVTTVLFDHELLTLHDRLPLEAVKPMTEQDYEVRGCTALIDAIGTTVRHIAQIHHYANASDVPANTMFVIITDGMENASQKFTSSEVKQLIEQKKELGWEFLFIGANIDAVETASHFGIGGDKAVNYRADSQGTKVVYRTLAKAVSEMCDGAPLSADWSEAIDEDFRQRKF